MSGKILVAGGSGFIGSNIVTALWKAEKPVVVLSRHTTAARQRLSGIEVDYVKGDIRDPKTLPKSLRDVETVICCVQFPNHPVENPLKGYTYEKFDAQGTANLVAAAKEAGVKRFVYLSGAGVREGRLNLAHEPWFRAKIKAERAIIESGIPYTIFRPSWVYGREDRSLNKFIKFAQLLPFVPVIGNGTNRVQPLFIMDLARLVTQALENPKTVNQIYEVGGPQTLTMDEIVQTILEVLEKHKKILHQPKWLMKIVSLPMKVLRTPPLSPQAIDFITMEELVDNAKALKDFDVQLTPLKKALSKYLNPNDSAL